MKFNREYQKMAKNRKMVKEYLKGLEGYTMLPGHTILKGLFKEFLREYLRGDNNV